MERLFAGLPAPAIPLPGWPLLARPVPAGFPSPADDYAEERIDFNRYLVAEPEATFLVRATGDSMLGFGIHDGDLVVVERSKAAKAGDFVIAIVDDEFTLKELATEKGRFVLKPHNKAYPVIRPKGSLEIFGVMVGLVRRYPH